MTDIASSAATTNAAQTADLHANIAADSSAQKRALSYSSTLHQLITQIFAVKMPADRVLADYFRAHKKHGSKDRRVIRESLFGIFRWWGWYQQFEQPLAQSQSWFAILAFTAKFEQHNWTDIADAWAKFAHMEALSNQAELTDIAAKCQRLNEHNPQLKLAVNDLLPNWFWQHIDPLSTEQTEQLLQAMSTRPPIWARVQGISVTKACQVLVEQGIEATPSQYFADAINLGHKSINLNGLSLYKNGQLEIQDLGSQVIGQICAPKANEHWWDACSGAGGKTLQLRSLMLAQDPKSQGSIVASDIRHKPLEELHKRAKRAKYNHITTARWRSDALPINADDIDHVLVDAPCSCTGTWRRNPDMRWLDDESAITDKPELQLDILTRSSHAVKVGSHLVYATCSLASAENQQVLSAFLAAHPQFELLSVSHPFTQTPAEMLTVQPYQADSDGMFVAKMIKRR
ncbi:RsmB/NOP family class I SAM-dependent RNA methyltransferase [Shewanella sp. Scap07]|uniref:RsmB/NOP family class I SAM-dependent RNA methyltransferase n=1 Tax=Shewanella sp. Scap07 TaxID=2589987 RepID=UPI0015BEED16|nr:RsmB/NOP family class I SAM-dependent RNA methyltransferase [Shewanella sp. Scap07]QLE86304.1 RsmB/NOP family class I SAM-dependent RNA methyltransferase [Shewanella sp. Scap07]